MRARRFITRCEQGIAALEFAIILPVLVLLLVGIVELANYAVVIQRVNRLANAGADFLTQTPNVTTSDLDRYTKALSILMNANSNPSIIFSSVVYDKNAPVPCGGLNDVCVLWKYSVTGGNSIISDPGQVTKLPGGLTASPGQSYVVAEINFDYQPILGTVGNFVRSLTPHSLYAASVQKPRDGGVVLLQ